MQSYTIYAAIFERREVPFPEVRQITFVHGYDSTEEGCTGTITIFSKLGYKLVYLGQTVVDRPSSANQLTRHVDEVVRMANRNTTLQRGSLDRILVPYSCVPQS